MEKPLSGFGADTQIESSAKEIAAADLPDVRLLLVERESSDYPVEDIKTTAGWSRCTPETAKDFSAVAYFFARDLQRALQNRKQHVPIGLIDSTWGGTPAEAWTSMDTLGSDAALMPVFAAHAEKMNHESTEIRLDAIDKQLRAEGKPITPNREWHPNPVSWQPAGLYNAMVAPFTPLPIRGVIWYQGETNSALNRCRTIRPALPRSHPGLAQPLGSGQLSLPVRPDLCLLQHAKRKLGQTPRCPAQDPLPRHYRHGPSPSTSATSTTSTPPTSRP